MTDTLELPMELTKALEKAEKANNRAIRSGGYGASDVGLELTRRNLGTLAAYLDQAITQVQKNSQISHALRVAGELGTDLLALVALQGCLHAIALDMESTKTLVFLGREVAGECWAAGYTTDRPQEAKRFMQASRAKHATAKGRQNAVMAAAARAGYKHKVWANDLCAHVGAWLADCVVNALPDLFWWVDDPRSGPVLTVATEALAAVEDYVGSVILQRPVHLPRTTAPQPWTGWMMTNDDPRVCFQTTFLRTIYRDVAAEAKAAIKSGTMQPALDAVNALQSVPWRINTRMLDILKEVRERGIEVPGMPSSRDLPVPSLPKPWEDMDKDEQKRFLMERGGAEMQNRTLMADRLSLIEEVATADRMVEAGRFFTPMNCDWRGRVYGLCHFNFQREDRVRALFEFADGMPIGEQGLWWLKVHVANCGAFNKIDKQPLEQRVAWVDANMAMIRDVARDPFSEGAEWIEADSPFLFLAACIELCEALVCGPQYVTRIPVSFDGTCSGLQHLSAMTRDEITAAMVNLLDGAPQDVYTIVAEYVKARVQADLDKVFLDKDGNVNPIPHELARMFLAHGIDRKTAKRNVMTYSYSSKKFGMAGQQQVDMMDDLTKQVLYGKIKSHPFAPYHRGSQERPGKAARYIASHVYDAIEEIIYRPATAMKFLQGLAKALAHECKPLRWTSPVGIPWINRYHEASIKRIELWMHDKGIKKRTQVKVAVGSDRDIAKDKAANGVAPNFVHALDGAHLLLTVNASVAEGITNIATVHDSFGCLAPQAARFNQIIRAEMVRMYETHDVLSEILEQAKCDLMQHDVDAMSSVPEYGTLNLKEIENAPYAFA